MLNPASERSESSGRHVVIVGGGPSGVAAFVGLIRDATLARIDIVEPGRVGESRAFPLAQSPALLCNTSAQTMSLLADEPDDFTAYLRARGEASGADFVPRFLFSRYLQTRYRQHRERADGLGIAHTHVQARAVAIRKTSDGYDVILADGRRLHATDVLVCVGHGAPVVPEAVAKHLHEPAIFATPYPVEPLLNPLPPCSRVLVLGSSLSAIDTALLLCNEGHRVVMASRSGILPAVRTATPRMPAVPVNAAAFARLDPASQQLPHRLLRLLAHAARAVDGVPLSQQVDRSSDTVQRLRDEAELARSGRTDWQDALVQHVGLAGLALAGTGRATQKHALAHCWPLVGRYVSAFPLQTADRLLAHIAHGGLRIVARALANLERKNAWQAHWLDHAHDEFDAIVCATGFHKPRFDARHDELRLELEPSASFELPAVSAGLRVSLPGRDAAERIWMVGVASYLGAPLANAVFQTVPQVVDIRRQWREADRA